MPGFGGRIKACCASWRFGGAQSSLAPTVDQKPKSHQGPASAHVLTNAIGTVPIVGYGHIGQHAGQPATFHSKTQRTSTSVTLASSGPVSAMTNDVQEPTDRTVAGPKTALDCDVITLTRDLGAQARGLKAQTAGTVRHDPLHALYRPLAIKDVQGALCTASAKRG